MRDPHAPEDPGPYFVGAAYGPEDASVHQRIMERLRKMTPEEIFQTSVRSGIYSPDGRLLPPYADEPEDEPEASLDAGAPARTGP
jgi:hypothetical protein